MISHEFKTPLTAILCSTDFLLSQNGKHLDEDTQRLLNIIYRGGTILNEIVTDLLKVARLEAKASPVSKTTLHFEEILNALLEQFGPVLRERGLQVSSRGIEALPHFSGDKECLYDIFSRLLENAIKFTPDGGEIVISATLADLTALARKKELLARFNPSFMDHMGNAGYLQVEVRDSGVGIAPDERLNIFDTFYEIGDIRNHTSGKHKFQGKGAGLGLAIVKGMIEAHGGMVWVESPVSDGVEQPGSAFFLLIPLEDGPSQTVFPFMQADPACMSQLLLEGEPDE
jgi:signal transduction histidine kinase